MLKKRMMRLAWLMALLVVSMGAMAQQAKYVFYFIGDGMGVNQVNGAETYYAALEGRIGRCETIMLHAISLCGTCYYLFCHKWGYRFCSLGYGTCYCAQN